MIKLETERLILRDLQNSDADDIVEGLNDIEVSKWLSRAPYPYAKQDAEEYIKHAQEDKINYRFGIILKEENKLIGIVEACIKDSANKIAGGGIWLNRKYQGKGYGKEAFNRRIEFIFNDLKMDKIENGFFTDNIASKTMQEKLGYEVVSVRKNAFISMATGKEEDEVVTILTRDKRIH